MSITEFLSLWATKPHVAEEFLQNPDCSDDIKREYLGDYEVTIKNATDRKVDDTFDSVRSLHCEKVADSSFTC